MIREGYDGRHSYDGSYQISSVRSVDVPYHLRYPPCRVVKQTFNWQPLRAHSTEFDRRLARKALHGTAIKRPVITLPAHNALTSYHRPLESRSRKPGTGLMQILRSLSQWRRRNMQTARS